MASLMSRPHLNSPDYQFSRAKLQFNFLGHANVQDDIIWVDQNSR